MWQREANFLQIMVLRKPEGEVYFSKESLHEINKMYASWIVILHKAFLVMHLSWMNRLQNPGQAPSWFPNSMPALPKWYMSKFIANHILSLKSFILPLSSTQYLPRKENATDVVGQKKINPNKNCDLATLLKIIQMLYFVENLELEGHTQPISRQLILSLVHMRAYLSK